MAPGSPCHRWLRYVVWAEQAVGLSRRGCQQSRRLGARGQAQDGERRRRCHRQQNWTEPGAVRCRRLLTAALPPHEGEPWVLSVPKGARKLHCPSMHQEHRLPRDALLVRNGHHKSEMQLIGLLFMTVNYVNKNPGQ